MKKWIPRTLAVLIVSCVVLPLLAEAGCFGRQNFFRRGRQVFFIQQPQQYVQVGSGLREQAIATKAAQEALRLFMQQLTQAAANGGTFQGLTQSSDAGARSIFAANCNRCHSGATPEKGLDLTAEISAEMKMRIALRVFRGDMPPKGKGARVNDAGVTTLTNWALQK